MVNVHILMLQECVIDDDVTYESSIWGPTCDGLDCILNSVQLPEHQVGEWLYFEDMGAYTVAAASTFNGMPGPTRSYYCLQELWYVTVLCYSAMLQCYVTVLCYSAMLQCYVTVLCYGTISFFVGTHYFLTTHFQGT